MSVDFTFIFFIFFSLFLIVSATAVIFLKNSVHAATSLIFSFIFAACLWLLMGAEFLAIVLILVYVGAVMVLFLFVVMMISRSEEVAWSSPRSKRIWFVAAGFSLFLFIELFLGVVCSNFGISIYSQAFPSQMIDVSHLGVVLFTRYFYPFELVSILLFLGVLSAVVLAHRVRVSGKPKSQTREEQSMVRAKDRITVVSVPSAHCDSGDDV